MTIKTLYNLGQIVYLVTDPEQLPRIVVQINYDGATMYKLVSGTDCSTHYETELSTTRDELMRLT